MKSKANVMALKAEEQSENRLDWLKWLAVVGLLLAGIVANHYYSGVPMPLRMLAWLATVAVAGFVASLTEKGRWIVQFFIDSRMELRKVVWPTRQETTQMTMIVAAMVVILALLLWGVDGVLLRVIGWLTGQRG